jgi:cytochrome bd ubiquinol oxidase subunit I
VTALDLARLQFATTTIYHFLFVPITIGLAFVVAGFETAYVRTGNEMWLRLTKFFGRLFLINFAIGVATGIVQEFQFGMNWSSYSRYVGDIFGAPLAMEGLAAFALESTFIGLWIFGWNRMRKGLHASMMWLTAIGTVISAYFILAANSWMQHPVGYRIDETTGRPVLDSILPVLFQPLVLLLFGHTLLAATITAGTVVLAVSAWQLLKRANVEVFAKVAGIALAVLLVVSPVQLLVGHQLGLEAIRDQPMKMAAGEALWETEAPASFSIVQIGGWSADSQQPLFSLDVPYLLSLLNTLTFTDPVQGINELQAQYEQQFGPGVYFPPVFIVYWAWRIMIYPLALIALLGLIGLVLYRRRRLPEARWFLRLSVAAVVLPFIMTTAGWVFTEVGRQPWVVYNLLQTANAVSPAVPLWMVGTSLLAFLVLYGVLTVTNFWLMARYARNELSSADEGEGAEAGQAGTLTMSY